MLPSKCIEALSPERDSRLQSWQRCEPRKQHQDLCLGSARTISLRPLTTLHGHTANPVPYRLGLVGIRPLGHVHSGGSQGAPGLLFGFHWHPVLLQLLLQGAHHLPHSGCLLCPQNRPPPLLWLQAGLIHQYQCINDPWQCTCLVHLDTKSSVSNSLGALSSNTCSFSTALVTSCSICALFLAVSSIHAINSNMGR